jgi:hypothetical protein
MALTKTGEVSLFALASVTSNTVSVGSGVDVSTYYGAQITARMGRGTATGFTTAPVCRIEGSYKTAPTADEWVVLNGPGWQPALGASIGSQAVSGTEAAGQTVVTLAAGTNFASGDYVFFHNTTIGNSEWCRVVSVATADLTLEEGLVNAQTGATCRDQAEQFQGLFDLTGINRLRAVIDGRGTGQANIWEVVLGAVSGL